MASACKAAIVGYELCADRSNVATIAVAARNAATNLRTLLDLLPADSRARTGDRLRWEWLASTATVLDGAADARLLAECARILSRARPTEAEVDDPELVGRFLVASAEAYSLASAVVPVRLRSALAFT
jgi:hypothetical protein